MTRRTQKFLLIGGAVLLVLVIAFSVPWKVNFLRDDIGRRVEAATGRAFAIDGDLWWHWYGRVEAGKLRFANPPWAGREQMLTVEKLDARLKLLPLLKRQLVLTQVHALNPDLWLETTADGRFNGNLDREQSDRESTVQLGRVVLDQGRLSSWRSTSRRNCGWASRTPRRTGRSRGWPRARSDDGAGWS
jgi:uncharacterized protein involved in outer membrane biogenesis